MIPHIVMRGVETYATSLEAMRRYTNNRTLDTEDQLWVVEHPPVFTLGLGANPNHILNAHDIPVVQSDRGGEVTYHGPGQVVIYLLIDLLRLSRLLSCYPRAGGRLFVREFVYKIEQVLIDVLASYQLQANRKQGAPGVYIGAGSWQGAKIAALGLRIHKNGCSYHGLALNVAMDLTPFSWIHPCGYMNLSIVDMRTLGLNVPVHEVQRLLANKLAQHFAETVMI